MYTDNKKKEKKKKVHISPTKTTEAWSPRHKVCASQQDQEVITVTLTRLQFMVDWWLMTTELYS